MINVTRSYLPEKEAYFAELASVFDSHWLTNMGEKHNRLQGELASYLGVDYVRLFANGHLALEAGMRALGLSGEVITTPFTFASTTHAITRAGCTPVFADIDPDTYTLDPNAIEALITEKTSAIVPVHVYGTLADVDAIEAIAKKHGLKVFYDAAHAFGVKKDGRGAASFGAASMFSFHATKVFHTVEGGAVTFSDPSLAAPLELERDFGIIDADTIDTVGANGKMSEFHAAMGLCNLKIVDREIAKRRHVVERYRARLENVAGIRLIAPQKGVTSNYAYFPVVFDGFRRSRDEVAAKLIENGITPRKYFYPLTSSFACYRGCVGANAVPVAEHIAGRVLTLPLYGDLADADVDRISELILEG